jgi:hypothetical protein
LASLPRSNALRRFMGKPTPEQLAQHFYLDHADHGLISIEPRPAIEPFI